MEDEDIKKHKKYIGNYIKYFKNNNNSKDNDKNDHNKYKGFKTDLDTLKEYHQFIRDEDDDQNNDSWERRLAKKYYDRLFKEYAIIDLSQYQTGQVGMRWRTEQEVFNGKGQFICANRKCLSRDRLKSFEVPFTYFEDKEEKSALVKVVLCHQCAKLLNYTNIKKKKKELKKLLKEQHKIKKKRRLSDGNSDSEEDSSDSNEDQDQDEDTEDIYEEKHIPEKELNSSNVNNDNNSSNLTISSSTSTSTSSNKRNLDGNKKDDEIAKKEEQDKEFDKFFEGLFP